MSIQRLPEQVVAQIKSSITITSLNGVIRELLRNSLDAGSTKVDLTVDYSRGSCMIEDNGFGIHPDEFSVNGGLGKMYHTSKWNSQIPIHGGRGIFLAALSAMALVTITSHHHLHRSHNTLRLHRSQVVSRQTPSSPHQHLATFNHGTRITIYDLFGNMPVRIKQRAIKLEKQGTEREWDELKHEIVRLLLPWPSDVAISVRESCSNRKMVIRAPPKSALPSINVISSICSILSQASYITPEEKASWVTVGVSTERLKLRGAISLEPCATKTVQFLSLGIEPISKVDGHNVLHDEINRLFMNSAFGNVEESVDLDDAEQDRRAKDKRYKSDGYTNKELKATRKGVDRWPKYSIKIELEESDTYGNALPPDPNTILDEKNNDLNTILELLQIMIREFLEKYQFCPKIIFHDRSKLGVKENPQLLPISAGGRSGKATTHSSEDQSTALSMMVDKQSLFDPLGVNVKLPLFHQAASTKEVTPFDHWRRIKTGNRYQNRDGKHSARPSIDEISQIRRPFSAPPSTGAKSEGDLLPQTLTPDSKKKAKLPISRNGKITRRPFDGVDNQKIKPIIAKISTQVLPNTSMLDKLDNDHPITWVNPTTKMKSVVDARTGFTYSTDSLSKDVSTETTRPRYRQKLRRLSSSDSSSPSPWVTEILRAWDNPVFTPAEQSIPILSFDGVDISTRDVLHGHRHNCSQPDIDQAFKNCTAGINSRISKSSLRNAKVISQVDKKFVLLRLMTSKQELGTQSDVTGGEALVILDQHAADERIRIEILLEELCSPTTNDNLTSSLVKTQALDKPLLFGIPSQEVQPLITYKQHFLNWGILYEIPASPSRPKPSSKGVAQHHLMVHSLPPGIIERCKLDSRLLIDFIRSEVWKVHETGAMPLPKNGTWLRRIHDCPQGLIDMLNSRACRSAIMFNDELTLEQCQALVRRLAECKFPFQCAHGRPSVVPLVELEAFAGSMKDVGKFSGFGGTFRRWKQGSQ